MCKDNLLVQYCFIIIFVVFNTVNLYIFVSMTCSTPCCLYDALMDPRNVCMMYVLCVHPCMYVYMCVCMYIYLILHAEKFYHAAMILSLVRKFNSCRSI
jgi:hypothetical protein